jgi:primary-amine oxidase
VDTVILLTECDRTVNMVRINYGNGSVSNVRTFGQQEAVCSVDLSQQEPDLYSYTGDVVIRKFPYGEIGLFLVY